MTKITAGDVGDAAATPGEDAALMRGVQSGDETAFAELMQRWELPVKSVIARIILNASEAEDLAQETFVRLWQHRRRFDPSKAVKPWILGIAINLARNRLRWWKRRPTVSLEDWTETPASTAGSGIDSRHHLERQEKAIAIRDAVAALPRDLREAIVLFEYEHMSYAEIAATLDATPKAIENRIARAREKLRVSLKSWA
jgi:RNA polymerase sigma factor (sigma-70 family)